MTKKFAELRVRMPAEAQKRAYELAQTMMQEMGGQLDVIARFADGSVRIIHFADIGGLGNIHGSSRV
jgi:hypothetical protein